ncbi:hypothetical protein [Aquabacter spiritensis]|uniref:Uncharacterized protein n=1 Tax=Aquabacter spiritensis TaxID=933073 RepID=A0A4R3LZ71_9HYPH|nr:hypothetical protein [Aquabacter spiritensis]TCT05179.1 hypothetical protein EDC64_105210 [Aquabacter spiritensis]
MSSTGFAARIRDISDAASDERHAALSYLDDAWTEAVRDGLDEDSLVQAALFTALRSLVATYGEEPCATYVEGLAARIRAGEYTLVGQRQ